jgi:MSHA biogenesis protein MshO
MRPMRKARAPRGFTLVEMVLVIVIASVLAVMISSFVTLPIRGAVDVARRAELTDLADNALRRMDRDLRRALPNSVRVTTVGASTFIEFLEVRAGGRYRSEPSGAATTAASCSDAAGGGGDGDGLANEDVLEFGVADRCFRTLGIVADLATIVPNSDWLVVYNLGPGYASADAYASGDATGGNKARITSVDVGSGGEQRIGFESHTFQSLSPGARFQVVSGAVTYECNPVDGVIRRYAGYGVTASQSTTFTVVPAVLASNVSTCGMTYTSGATERSGLVRLEVTLSRDGESIALDYEVMVGNVP